YRRGDNLTWPVGVLIVTTPHEHDPGCLTLLATAFSQRLDACGALGAHQCFYLLAIHDFGARTSQPAQQGLIDGADGSRGIHFPESDWSIFKQILRTLPDALYGRIWSGYRGRAHRLAPPCNLRTPPLLVHLRTRRPLT